MEKKIHNLVLIFISVILITFLTGVWQNQSFLKGNSATSAEVPSLTSHNDTDLKEPDIPLFTDKILQRKSWKLVFSDNFKRANLNLNKWNTCYWQSEAGGCTNSNNQESQWYQPDDVLVENGVLRLRAQARNVKEGYNYTSGMVTSEGKFNFQYGYFEIRAKVPKGQGLWPAFWTLPTQRNLWPPEIDVVEVLGNKPNTIYMSNHYRKNGDATYATQDFQGDDFSADFHKFGVLWQSNIIVWVVDGVERFRVTNNIPNLPMYLLINLAVGGKWPGYPDSTTVFPNYYDVDYVRVWQTAG